MGEPARIPRHEGEIGVLLRERGPGHRAAYARFVNPKWAKLMEVLGLDIDWERGEDRWLIDADGNRYLDLIGNFGTFAIGRGNLRVGRAVAEVIERKLPNLVGMGTGALTAILAEELVSRTAPTLERVLFTSSGTESVETAIKLARAATGRSRVVYTQNGFHGQTLGALSAMGNPEWRDPFEPLVPGFTAVPFGDSAALEREVAAGDVALFLVEPIQGKGVIVPEPDYLPAALDRCRRHGTLLCVDEVMTGMGRCGKLFAHEHWGIDPDFMTLSKALSGGWVPVGACLLRADVFDDVFDSLRNASIHSSTFGGSDMAMAAGIATLREIEERDLAERAAALGPRLLEQTRELAERHDVVRDVRGLGLLWAMEFGQPDGAELQWRMVERLDPELFAELVAYPLLRDHRIIVELAGHELNAIKITPPLTLEHSDIDRFVDALDQVLSYARHMPRALAAFGARVAKAYLPATG